MTAVGLPIETFKSQQEWHQWLNAHQNQPGVWIKIAKKNSGIPSVTHAEALDEALCYGWIDGQRNGLDKQYFLQKFTPRRPKSMWSKVNIEKVAALTDSGRMQPAGLSAVEAAQQDGRWEAAYDSSSTMTVPLDFQEELNNNPVAREFYQTLNKTNTYAILWRIQTAKKSTTRKTRIDKFIAMLNNGEKLHN